MNDLRLSAPAAARNRDPIVAVLRRVLPPAGLVVEVASGSGEHIVHFARHFPELIFQPTDQDPVALRSIAAWAAESGLDNIAPPIALDATEGRWPIAHADAVLCINMVHIAPWRATEGLMRGAAALLPEGAPLYLYGPYRRSGGHTAASNESFDRWLRSSDPAWGVRDLESVTELAEAAGFGQPDITEMPANNLSLVFRRRFGAPRDRYSE